MAINIVNKEADALTRKFAEMEDVSISDAVVIAMREAIERRRNCENPLETADRIREKYGIVLTKKARKALPRSVYDELYGDKG